MQMLLKGVSQLLLAQVGIYLCGGDIFVSEQLLHLSYAGPSLQQMRSEGVSEGVGADAFVYIGTGGSLLDDGENHHSRELFSPIVQKESLLLAVTVACFEVELYAVACYAAYGYEALLVSLARNTNIPLTEEEVADAQVA